MLKLAIIIRSIRRVENSPIFANNPSTGEIGPLEAMVFELEYNLQAVHNFSFDNLGHRMKSEQFNLAISRGSLFILPENVKEKINSAYLVIGQIETYINRFVNASGGNQLAEAKNELNAVNKNGESKILDALSSLEEFLGENVEK